MTVNDNERSLCIYGVSLTLAVELIGKYGSEDDIPLNEFDPVEYQKSRHMRLP